MEECCLQFRFHQFFLSAFQHQTHSNVRESFLLPWITSYNRLNTPFPSFLLWNSQFPLLHGMFGRDGVSQLTELQKLSSSFLSLDCSISYWINIGSKSETILSWRLEWWLPSLTLLYAIVLFVCRQNRSQYRFWKLAPVRLGPVLYWWVFSAKNNYRDLSRGTWKTQAPAAHRQVEE